jgi:hypothetical protein
MHVSHTKTFRENIKNLILIFFAKKVFQMKTSITFAYGLKKMCNILKTIDAKVTSDFNRRRPFTQILTSQIQREI